MKNSTLDDVARLWMALEHEGDPLVLWVLADAIEESGGEGEGELLFVLRFCAKHGIVPTKDNNWRKNDRKPSCVFAFYEHDDGWSLPYVVFDYCVEAWMQKEDWSSSTIRAAYERLTYAYIRVPNYFTDEQVECSVK